MNLTRNNKSVKTDEIHSKNGSKSLGRVKTKKLRGDGLILCLENNERDIELSGDGCKLTIAVNSGRIRIHGDGCCLKIQKNSGHIEYRGDGGRVSLGGESTLRKVDYIGDGGKIDIAKEKNHARQCRPVTPVTEDNKDERGGLDFSKKTFLLGDPVRTDNRPNSTIDKNYYSTDEKSFLAFPMRKKAFDDFAKEFLKSRNIDASLGGKKEPEQCIRTTVKTVRIFYDNKHSRTQTKSRTKTKSVRCPSSIET
ncbi:uncharacterized protein pirk [Venturia canescens]|uniref:uncharacterized protein pirk n=1 Tax=Venturia canescens TaxID=32260 RepID=UPI001C9CEE09|nr:uncharacterized protein LOC122409173 [Venturia canescens]